MYDPYDAFATTEDDNDQDQDHIDDLGLEDADVIDDVDAEAMAAAGFAPAFVAAAPEASPLVKLKQRALVRWQRPVTRWVALAIAIAVVLAGGGTWSILDTRAKNAAVLSAAKATHAATIGDIYAFAGTADSIADAAAPFGLDAERTALTDSTTALRKDLAHLKAPGNSIGEIPARTTKASALKAPVTANLDAVLTGVDAATTAKLGGAPLVSDDEKGPTVEAMTAVTEAFGTLTEVPAALTALAAAHAELQGKQDAAQAAAEAEAARVAAEEAAAAAAAEQAARATGDSSAGQGTGPGAGARPGTGNSGRPGTGGGTRPGTGAGANPGTGGGGGGGTAPGTGGGNPGGGGTGPAPYTNADAWSAVVSYSGARALSGDCLVINSGTWGRTSSPPPPARQLIGAGGWLAATAASTGQGGTVTYYACY